MSGSDLASWVKGSSLFFHIVTFPTAIGKKSRDPSHFYVINDGHNLYFSDSWHISQPGSELEIKLMSGQEMLQV